ncbi:MAG: hypothetical protein IPL32_18495 [Chloracidobacterium sp.]|nr:hypothetical protein [Chloracidobacterium sp.]
MKWVSGVSDDDKKSDVRDVVASRSVLRGVRGGGVDGGTNMKGKNERTTYRTEPGSNVIAVDFAHCRAIRDMRKRLHELGVFVSSSDGAVT